MRVLTEQQEGVRAVCAVCGWNAKMMGGRAAKLYAVIVACGGTWMELEAHYGQIDTGAAWWWYRDFWLGRKGERPDDGWIRKTWELHKLPIAVSPSPAHEPAGYDSLRVFLGRSQDAHP